MSQYIGEIQQNQVIPYDNNVVTQQNQVIPFDNNKLVAQQSQMLELQQCYLNNANMRSFCLSNENEYLSLENQHLKSENTFLKEENRKLNLEKDKQSCEIQELRYEVEDLKEESKKTIDQRLYDETYSFSKYKEFISFLCECLSLNLEIKCVYIKDLQLIEDLDYVSNHVYKDMEFKLEFNKGEVVLSFDDDIQKYLDREEYIKSNPDRNISEDKLHLNLLINELKKIGDGRKVDNQYKLKMNPIKSAIYIGKTVYVYVSEEFTLKNKKKIDMYIQDGVERCRIGEEVENKRNIYNFLIKNTLKKGDLIVIPDMNILGDNISDVLVAIIDIFVKEADILLEEFLIEYKMYFKLDNIQLLGKLKNIIEAKECKKEKSINDETFERKNIGGVKEQESKIIEEDKNKVGETQSKESIDISKLINE